MLMALAASAPVSAQSPFGCDTPVGQRPGEIGCYLTTTEDLATLTQGSVFWHIYDYPTRAAAESARGRRGTVVESFGKVWLYTIADERWRPSGGARVAVIGPLAITPGTRYAARHMEAVFAPGMKARR